MDNFHLDDEYVENIEAQIKLWANFLNMGIGLLAFTLGIASLGTASPVINSWLSLLVVMIVRIQGTKYFPAEIQRLRQLSKENSKAKILLDGLMAKYFAFKTNFTLYPILMVGILFLVFIALSPVISITFPLWKSYVGI